MRNLLAVDREPFHKTRPLLLLLLFLLSGDQGPIRARRRRQALLANRSLVGRLMASGRFDP